MPPAPAPAQLTAIFRRSQQRAQRRHAEVARARRRRARVRAAKLSVALAAVAVGSGVALGQSVQDGGGPPPGQVGAAQLPPLHPPLSGDPTAALLERIAECESGGDPTAIGGGGLHRGKYQFTRETWHDLGGAGDPAAAPEAEQDRRAAQLLRERGTAPWPNCA